MTVRKITFFVNVVGGIGSTQFIANGKLQLVAIKVPRAGATENSPLTAWEAVAISPNGKYDYDIQDEDAFGIAGYPQLVGDQTNLENKCLGDRKCTFTILNAAQDGVYLVRIYWESEP